MLSLLTEQRLDKETIVLQTNIRDGRRSSKKDESEIANLKSIALFDLEFSFI